jgi:Spy/CpxP family protein refolding chaperone
MRACPPDERKFFMTLVRKILVTAMVVVSVAVVAAAANAQPPGGGQPGGPPGGGRGFGFGGFGGFGGGGLADTLRRDDVRKELELLDDQVEKLTKLAEARAGQMREMFSGMQDMSEEERRAEMQKRFEKARTESEKQIGEILLPHQMKRLKQLSVQLRLQGPGTGIEGVGDDIGLTEDQKEKLRAKAEQLREDLRKKMAEWRKQAQDEMVKMLTPDQQAKFKSLVGEPFEFQQPQFGGPGGPGGPPQFGGQRRGGNGQRGGGDGQRGGGDRPRRPE